MKTLLRSRVLAWVLTLAMVVTFMPTMAFAAPGDPDTTLWTMDFPYAPADTVYKGYIQIIAKGDPDKFPKDAVTPSKYYEGMELSFKAVETGSGSPNSDMTRIFASKSDGTFTMFYVNDDDFIGDKSKSVNGWNYLQVNVPPSDVPTNDITDSSNSGWLGTYKYRDVDYPTIIIPDAIVFDPAAVEAPMLDYGEDPAVDVAPEDFKVTTEFGGDAVNPVNKIQVKATDVPKSVNKAKAEGYWIGFGVKADGCDSLKFDGVTYDYADEDVFTVGEGADAVNYIPVYFDAQTYLDYDPDATPQFTPKTLAPTIEYNGIEYLLDLTNVSLDTAQTRTTLSIAPETQVEGQEIVLTADVIQVFDNSKIPYRDGVVRFYENYVDEENTGTFLGEVELDTNSQASLTIPAGDYDLNEHKYTAVFVYVGTEPDKFDSSHSTKTFNSTTSAIQTKDFSKDITTNPAMDASGKLTVGTEYTLSIPDVYLMGQTNKLTNGQEYTVEWQWSTDGGTWNAMADNTDSITVSPPNAQTKYRAVIKPLSPYAKACEGMTEATEETPAQPKYTDDNTLVMDELESAATQTTIELAVSDYASEDGENLTEYEGEPVTLTATVKYGSSDNPNPVGDGFVYFYKKVDGEMIKINEYPVVVLDGVAQITNAQISAYDIDKGQTENKDVFTAEFKGSDIFAPSGMSNEMTVLIRSTKLDVPVICAKFGNETKDTASEAIEDMPAGTPIVFKLVEPVKAQDGRVIAAEDGYTLQWEQNSNQGMFENISGATASTYELPSGDNGDSFRLTLVPTGHMKEGATSLKATIGTLADPTVTLDAVKTFEPTAANLAEGVEPTAGSHFGDNVTLTATVTGTTVRPTGFVEFWYKDSEGNESRLGKAVKLTDAPGRLDAEAEITTAALPQGDLTVFVKYLGDETYQTEDTLSDADPAPAGSVDETAQTPYKVWSVQISNDEEKFGALTIAVDPEDSPLIADKKYTLKLVEPVYTEDGELLKLNDTYEIEWQESTNGTDWTKVSGASSSKTATVKPATDKYQYRAQVKTKTKLFAEPKNDNRLDTEYTLKEVSSNVQAVTINLSTNKKDLDDPYKDAVYEGNDITLVAEIVPTVEQGAGDSAKAVTGKVTFWYSEDDGATWIQLRNTDAVPKAEIEVKPADGKYVAEMTTDKLPSKEAKEQTVKIKAEYSGDETYDQKTDDTLAVTVFSSNVFGKVDGVENTVMTDSPSESTAGIIIYAPDDVLVSDGTPTTLTLKPIYTMDAEDGMELAADIPQYSVLEENTNYSVAWQYTEALNAENPDASQWTEITGTGHTVSVAPQAGFAYRAVITVTNETKSDVTDTPSTGRTFKSEKTYYSNILAAVDATAVLQLRAIPASSGGTKDTEMIFENYVAGGTNVPAGEISMVITNSKGEKALDRTGSTVNGQVIFGAGSTFGDTAGPITLPADIYSIESKYTGNNGYEDKASINTYIVRYKTEEIEVTMDPADYEGLIYNGKMQRPDKATVTFNGGEGHDLAQTLADKSVVFSYEMKVDGEYVPIDYPKDAGDYRVTATLPQSIYYEAQTSEALEFSIAQREVEINDILVQAKVYDGKTDASLLDVELAFAQEGEDTGVIPGDSVFAYGTAKLEKAEALVNNTVSIEGAELFGPDKDNYVFKEGGDQYSEAFKINRNQIVVDSSAVSGTNLNGLIVYDNYGKVLAKNTNYTVRFFLHDGTGVKEAQSLKNTGKYTIIIAPKDTANYKGGETFIMKDGAFAENDDEAEAIPAVVTYNDTMQELDPAEGNTLMKSAEAAEVTNETVTTTGRYPVSSTLDGAEPAYGVFHVFKTEADHIVPSVEGKVYDGKQAVVANESEFPEGTYFSYTGGEIIGVTYDAPKDVGEYTVTAHVPATEEYVAYSETSTFEITQKEITVAAQPVSKQLYRTNPYLWATYDELCENDSDVKDMIALPSMEILGADGNYNVDLNTAGNFTVRPSGVISRNYIVKEYLDANFAVKAEDPKTTMTIVGLPQGQVFYGDEFQVAVDGTFGQRVDEQGTYNNQSSVLEYFVSKDGEWVKDNGNVVIDDEGFVKINGAAAEDFTIRATRGTGDYKIYAEAQISVKKRPIVIGMKIEDSKVYNGAEQELTVPNYEVRGTVGSDTIELGLTNFTPNKAKDVGDYQISGSYKDAKYEGTGKGLFSITPFVATVTTKGDGESDYGTAPVFDDPYYTDNAFSGDTLLTGPVTYSFVQRTILNNSDVGEYEAFTIGAENENYVVDYDSGKYTVKPIALEMKAGVDGTTNFTISNKVEREYGVENPIMGYQNITFVEGDSLADLLIDAVMVNYERVQEDDANLSGAADRAAVNEKADDWGKIDLSDTITNINENAENYFAFTLTDGLLNIFQKQIEVTVNDITIKAGTEITQDMYTSEVDRVLTEKPMSDTLDDLGIEYSYESTADPNTKGTYPQSLIATLREGTADLAQNYFIQKLNKGTLVVTEKEADADIQADKDGVSVTTTEEVPANNYVPVYTKDDDGNYQPVEGMYIANPGTAEDADEDGYSDSKVPAGTALVNEDGTPLETPAVVGDTYEYFVSVDEVTEEKTVPANVGDIDYTVYDKDGNKVDEGTMKADPEKPGEYKDSFDQPLPKGDYTIAINPNPASEDGYALNPNTKDFTAKSDGGGGGGGGDIPEPPVQLNDHASYIAGYPDGTVKPNGKVTRAETSTIIWRLMTDAERDEILTAENDFSDVTEDLWYNKAVSSMVKGGFIKGYPDGTFRGDNQITRAEFVTIMSRIMGVTTGASDFSDVDGHWAADAIGAAAEQGWVNGYEDGTFRPDNPMTRAEVMAVMNRIKERGVNEKSKLGDSSKVKTFSDNADTSAWYYYEIVEATNDHQTSGKRPDENWATNKVDITYDKDKYETPGV